MLTATAIAETEARFRADPAAARSAPTVTATLANGRARLSAGPFNWDADLPAAARRREPRPEPDRVPARRAGRLRRRVPARHAGAPVRRPDRRRHGRRPRRSDARGLLGIDGVAPDLADLALESRSTSPVADDRIERDARRLAGALPDLPRAAEAERDRPDDRRRGRRVIDEVSRTQARSATLGAMPRRNGEGIALLADPTRRRIIASLAIRPSRPSTLAETLNLSRFAVSRQLRLLHEAGLVVPHQMRSDRRAYLYTINSLRHGAITAWLAGTDVGRTIEPAEAAGVSAGQRTINDAWRQFRRARQFALVDVTAAGDDEPISTPSK